MLEGFGFWFVATVLGAFVISNIYTILSNDTKPRDPKITRVTGLVTMFLSFGCIYFIFLT